MIKAHISEIFGSVQGEGPLAGEPFIFVRFAGCPWRCDYCDEPESLTINGHRRLSVEEVLDEVHRIQKDHKQRVGHAVFPSPLRGEGEDEGDFPWSFIHPPPQPSPGPTLPPSPAPSGHPLPRWEREGGEEKGENGGRWVSLTGGEPLTQWSFISALAPLLQKLGFQTYLETSGTFPEALEKVVKYFDVVSLDIKAPSAIGREFWKEHERCLHLARERCFVKMVLTKMSRLDEVEKASRLVASVNRKIPFVLQPATAFNGALPASEDFQRKAQALAREFLDEVCIQPQMHPIWSVR